MRLKIAVFFPAQYINIHFVVNRGFLNKKKILPREHQKKAHKRELFYKERANANFLER